LVEFTLLEQIPAYIDIPGAKSAEHWNGIFAVNRFWDAKEVPAQSLSGNGISYTILSDQRFKVFSRNLPGCGWPDRFCGRQQNRQSDRQSNPNSSSKIKI
jgi:hypothetical protein